MVVNKNIIFLTLFTIIVLTLILLNILKQDEFISEQPTQINPIHIKNRPPIKINNDFPSGKPIIVDVVIPLIAKNLIKIVQQLNSWNEVEALPCDENIVPHYYAGAKSNLIFYLNFLSKPQIESTINEKVESAIWRKCFNQIKYIYANNTLDEDGYPRGISVQFYKYFTIGSPSDYFFWMEADVNVIRKNWQIELFHLVIQTNEVRSNKAFFMMGSNYISAIENSTTPDYSLATHINGNALFWNNRDFYDQFLIRSKWNLKRIDAFDIDITIQLNDHHSWDLVRDIRQEFITHDFIRNYNYVGYDKREVLANFPRTYFIHHSIQDYTKKR